MTSPLSFNGFLAPGEQAPNENDTREARRAARAAASSMPR